MNLYVHKTPVKEQLLGSRNLSLVLVGTQTGLVTNWFLNSSRKRSYYHAFSY